MKVLLLDTCTLVWLTSAPERISEPAKVAMDAAEDLFVSDVSIWEICLKWQTGKLRLPSPPRQWVTEQLERWSLGRISLEPDDLFRSSELADLHRDPFDRVLVAQTIARGAQLITPDRTIHSYPVAVLW